MATLVRGKTVFTKPNDRHSWEEMEPFWWSMKRSPPLAHMTR